MDTSKIKRHMFDIRGEATLVYLVWRPFTEQGAAVDTEALGWEFQFIVQQQRNIYAFYTVHLPEFKRRDRETYDAYKGFMSPEMQGFARKAWRKLAKERKAIKLELAKRGEKMRKIRGAK